ncbi:uncharacterized protein METZ01_LOCUS449198 [marine metagenome]|uniref:Uncharacterized protein n=1 Tax=marine metagenome TaxID=408172 RepID=A0A382ZLK9_9ZZZZ
MALLDLFSSKNRILKHNAISLAHEIIDTSIWLCLEIRTILLIADEKLKNEHFLDEDDPDSMVGWPKMEFIKYILKNTTFLYMHIAHRGILGNLDKEEQSIFMLEMDKTIFELFLGTVDPVWRLDANPDLTLQKLNQEALDTMNFYGSYKLVEVYEEFATELAHYLFYYEGKEGGYDEYSNPFFRMQFAMCAQNVINEKVIGDIKKYFDTKNKVSTK